MPISGTSGLNLQVLIQDQRANGTAGTGYAAGAWVTVPLNGLVVNDGGTCSLAANQFTLQAGGYEFESDVNPGTHSGGAGKARLRLRNITDGVTVVQGVQFSLVNDLDLMVSARGSFQLPAVKVCELQVWVTLATAAAAAMSTGDNEVYASLKLRRYA